MVLFSFLDFFPMELFADNGASCCLLIAITGGKNRGLPLDGNIEIRVHLAGTGTSGLHLQHPDLLMSARTTTEANRAFHEPPMIWAQMT